MADLAARKPPSSPMSSASVQGTEQQQRLARELRFGTMQLKAVASPSRRESPAVGEVNALGSLKGKQKAVKQLENSSSEDRMRLERRERLRDELAEGQEERRAMLGTRRRRQQRKRERAATGDTYTRPVMCMKYQTQKNIELVYCLSIYSQGCIQIKA